MSAPAVLQLSAELTQPLSAVAGVHYGQLDPSISRAVQALFPARSSAQQFLKAFLAYASVESALPDDESAAFATIRVKGYKELSQLLRLAYETTHMYTLVYRVIGLLFVEKQEGELTLRVPLGPYFPPDDLLKVLDDLTEQYRDHRPKVRRMLKNVTGRLQGLLKDSARSERSNQQSVSLELIDCIQQALSSVGIRENNQQIAGCIAAKIAHFIPKERKQTICLMAKDGGENLPQENQGDFEPNALPNEESAAHLPRRRGNAKHIQQNLPEAPSRVDSHSDTDLPLVDSVVADDSPVVFPSDASPGDENLLQRVDSLIAMSVIGNGIGNKNYKYMSLPDSVIVPPVADERRMPRVDSSLPHPVVVSQARQLALFVEGDERKDRGAFIKLIKNFSPRVRIAALLATMVRKHYPQGMGALRKPGGYYTQRCKEFQAYGVPNELVGLIGRCIDLPYCEVEGIVKASFRHLESRNRGLHHENDETEAIKPKRGIPMDKTTADALAVRISQEGPYAQVKGVQDVRHAEGIAYVVQVTIGRVDWDFASVEDWEYHHAQVQSLDE